MTQSVEIQELAIVVAAQNHSPTMLNLEFLKCSGVVPTDWQLARSPVFNNQASQLIFQNGTSLVAQANQVMFMEAMTAKSADEMVIGNVARQYIATLPHCDYQAVGINLRGYVPFNQPAETADQYMMKKLMAAGPWQQYGQEAAKASINFAYSLEGRRLLLSVNEAMLRLPEEQTMPIVLFSGNFEYRLEAGSANERSAQLMEVLQNWQVDLDVYKDLINNRFLASNAQTWTPSMSEPELVPVGA